MAASSTWSQSKVKGKGKNKGKEKMVRSPSSSSYSEDKDNGKEKFYIPDIESDEKTYPALKKPVRGKKFSFANRRIFLTYKSHIDKGLIREFFTGGRLKAVEVEIAHETGDEHHPYDHTHVYVDFGRRYQTTIARKFDIEGIHPHIKLVKYEKHRDNIYKYLTKEDPSNEHLRRRFMTMAEKVWRCKNKREVAMMADKPHEVAGLLTMYDLRDDSEYFGEFDDIEFIEWQHYLEEELKLPVDDRQIIWYVDLIGGCGKTFYCKYRRAVHRDVVISGNKDVGNVAHLIKRAIDDGSWNKKIVFFDFSRSIRKSIDYDTIEDVKNGMLTSTKYNGGFISIKSPHVVIFSNFYPDVDALSKDRWDIRDITDAERPKPKAIRSLRPRSKYSVSVDDARRLKQVSCLTTEN